MKTFPSWRLVLADDGLMVSEFVWGWIWSGFFLWICPFSPRRCTCLFAVFLGSSMQKVKKNIWCMEQAGEGKPSVLPPHNNLSETAGPHTSRKNENCQQTRQLPLSVWLRHVDTHQGLRCFQGAQNSSAWDLKGNKADYCGAVYNSAFCNTDIHQDKHVTHVLMICFAKV